MSNFMDLVRKKKAEAEKNAPSVPTAPETAKTNPAAASIKERAGEEEKDGALSRALSFINPFDGGLIHDIGNAITGRDPVGDVVRKALYGRTEEEHRQNLENADSKIGKGINYIGDQFATGILEGADVSGLKALAADVLTRGETGDEIQRMTAVADVLSKRIGGVHSDQDLLRSSYRLVYGDDISDTAFAAFMSSYGAEASDAARDQVFSELGEGFRTYGGSSARAVGQMLPSIALAFATGGTSAAASGASGSSGILPAIGTAIKGKSLAPIAGAIKAAIKGTVSTWYIGSRAAGGKFASNAQDQGGGLLAEINAAGTGAIEGFTEALFGFSDMSSVRRLFSPTGNTTKNVWRAVGSLAISSFEEGMEEVSNVPLEGTLDKATIDTAKEWFGPGGVFDGKAMLDAGITGAIAGVILGFGTSTVVSIAESKSNASDITEACEIQNRFAEEHLPEEIRPDPIDPATATVDDVVKHAEELAEVAKQAAQDGTFIATEQEVVSEEMTEAKEEEAPVQESGADTVLAEAGHPTSTTETATATEETADSETTTITYEDGSVIDAATGEPIYTPENLPVEEVAPAEVAEEAENPATEEEASKVEEQTTTEPAPAVEDSVPSTEAPQSTPAASYVRSGLTAGELAPRLREYGRAGKEWSDTLTDLRNADLIRKDDGLPDDVLEYLRSEWQEGRNEYDSKAAERATKETVKEKPAETAEAETPAKTEEKSAETAEEEEVTQQEFEKKFAFFLKAEEKAVIEFSEGNFITNGFVAKRCTAKEAEFAESNGFRKMAFNDKRITDSVTGPATIVARPPFETKYSGKVVHVFGNSVFDKKLVRVIDGGIFYTCPFSYGSVKSEILKSVDESGNLLGFCLPVRAKMDEIDLENAEPAKLKSFSEKMMPLIAAKAKESSAEVTAEQEASSSAETATAESPATVGQNAENAPDATKVSEDVTSTSQVDDTMKAEDGKFPSLSVSDELLSIFKSSGFEKLTARELYQICDKQVGGTMADGAYSHKDAYDAMELAVNRYLLTAASKANKDDAESASKFLAGIQSFLSKLPTQTVRSEEQQKFQQFSTPPNIAYVAAWAAGVDSSDVVLEPSAGIGGLAVFPKAWGATVAVNELSERRRGVISNMGFDMVTGEDAAQIQNVDSLDGVTPSVVIMNPPFSSQANTGAKNTAVSFKHVDAALEKLADNGRLVAILGAGITGEDTVGFSKWLKGVKKNYTVRANIIVDGKNYAKYGTSFNVRILVIDKIGGQIGETVAGNHTDLDEVLSKLKGVRDARLRGDSAFESNRGIESDSGRVREDTRMGERVRRRSDGVVGARVSVGDGQLAGVQRDTDGREYAPSGDSVQGADDGFRGRASGVEQPRSDGNGVRQSDDNRVRDGERGAAPSDGQSGLRDEGQLQGVGERRDDARRENVSSSSESDPAVENSSEGQVKDTGVFSTYITAKIPVEGTRNHPAELVESSAMASVKPPKATYKPHLPQENINNGVWSGEQLVNIVYAGQAHSQVLPDGNRRGYLIGDGTGVGKGRQIAGIIRDNMAQGRTKAVWISDGYKLLPDARRDWSATGGAESEVFAYERGKSSKIPSEGVMFTSYTTLSAKPQARSKDKESNLDKIIKWLGKDFDGVIAFDESHNMANSEGKNSGRGKSKPSNMAIAGIELQRALPKARIVYVSATAATSVSELVYAERLGLWGEGTAFPTKNEFLESIEKVGTTGMELVARDMKAMGVYNARSISYDGVEYDSIRHNLTEEQVDIYDTISEAWSIILNNVEDALKATNIQNDGKQRGSALSALYGTQQRFYQQLLCSMAMPSVITDIQRELDAGHSCVLQIVSTNESQQNRVVAEAKESGAELEELDFSPRNIISEYLRNAFPTQVYNEVTDGEGKVKYEKAVDANGNPIQSKAAIAMRERLLAKIDTLSIPDNPLDILFRAFGADNVAEVTGRTKRYVSIIDENGNSKTVEQKRTPRATEADVTDFQDGRKRILVFSDAGGTGKSYHADRNAKNQQQRIHYLVQPGWNATKATQGFGRTHRSNQVSAPVYKLVTTNVAGQARFVSTIAKRLDNLGAMTKGQREAGSGFFSASDNLESSLAQDALYNFYQRLDMGQYPDVDARGDIEKMGLTRKIYDHEGKLNRESGELTNVSLFLNRILALPVDEQNRLAGHFITLVGQYTDQATQNNTLDRGMEDIRADSAEIVDESILKKYDGDSEPTKYLQIKVKTKAVIERSSEEVRKMYPNREFKGFYYDTKGQPKAIFSHRSFTETDGTVINQYLVQSPNTGKKTIIKEPVFKNYKPVPAEQVQEVWQSAADSLPEYDTRTVHMITGAILPIWRSLSDSNIKVQRITLDNGQRFLGRVINEQEANHLLAGFNKKVKAISADEVASGLKRGVSYTATFSGFTTKFDRVRVDGQWRYEVTGRMARSIYFSVDNAIEEIINGKYRYFLPANELENAIKTLQEKLGCQFKEKEADTETQYSVTMDTPRSPAEEWRGGARTDETAEPESTLDEFADVKASDIVKMVERVFGVKAVIGGVGSHDAAGSFNPENSALHLRTANDIPTLMHEIGHLFEHRFTLRPFIKDHKEEFEGILGPKKESYKEKLRAREGFAEFMRQYFVDRYELSARFPDVEDSKGEITEGLVSLVENQFDEETLNEIRMVADACYCILHAKTPEELKSMNSQRKEVGTFLRAMARSVSIAKGGIDWTARNAKDDDLDTVDIGNGAGYRFMAEMVDRHVIFRQIAEAAKDRDMSAYLAALNSDYATGVAYSIVNGDHLTDMNGKIVGEGFGAIMREFYKKDSKGKRTSRFDSKMYDEFNGYLVVRHAPWRLQRGYKQFAVEAQNNLEWLENRRAEIEAAHPEFIKLAERVYAFETNLMQTWGVSTGLVSEETFENLQGQWEDYVPFLRDMDDPKKNNRKSRRSYANQQDVIRRATGSTRDILFPMNSIVKTCTNLVTESYRNNVMQKLVKTVEKKGNVEDSAILMERTRGAMEVDTVSTLEAKGGLLEELFMDSVKDGRFQKIIDDLKSKTENKGKSDQEINSMATKMLLEEIQEGGIMEMVNRHFDDTMKRFTQTTRAKESNDVTLFRNGKREVWKINNPELFRVLTDTGMDAGAVIGWFAKMTRLQTSMLTGLNVAWSLRSNMPRDMQGSVFSLSSRMLETKRGKSIVEKASVIPEAVKMIAKGYADSLHHSFLPGSEKTREDTDYQEWLAMAGGDSAVYEMKRDVETPEPKTKVQDATRYYGVEPIRKIGSIIPTLAAAIERGPRFAAYKYFKSIGYDPVTALNESRDITVNFKLGGRTSLKINRYIPFFNAGVQGLYKQVRFYTANETDATGRKVTGKERGRRIRDRVVLLTLTSVFGVVFQQLLRSLDREDYDRLSNYTKNNFWCIPIGNHKFVTIPKPREQAVLESFMERVTDWATGDEDSMKEFADYSIGMLLPPIVSDVASMPWNGFEDTAFGVLGSLGIFGPAVEAAANRNFLGSPIVPASLENFEPRDQYTESTSLVARWIGDAFNLSPAKIDHIGESVLGGLWEAQKTLIATPKNFDPTLGTKDYLIRSSVYSTDIVNKLYDNKEELQARVNSHPDDIEAAIDYKWYDLNSRFYSRYSALDRSTEDASVAAENRLNALQTVTEGFDLAENTDVWSGQETVEKLYEATGDASVFPAVMPTEFKDGNGIKVELDAKQYLEFQATYTKAYRKYVTDSSLRGLTTKEKVAAIGYAKDQAKADAKNAMLRSLGKLSRIETNYTEPKKAGVSLATYTKARRYKSSLAGTDGQEAAMIAYISRLPVPPSQKDALYCIWYSEDKVSRLPW